MKDRQVYKQSQDARIPVISPLLHVLSMPLLVFLRRDFGYSYLRPKSVFIALTYAYLLYLFYAINEPDVWVEKSLFCILGGVGVVLFYLHLARAVVTQLRGTAKHDYYSGKSWLLTIASVLLGKKSPQFRRNIQLWVEPLLIVILALAVVAPRSPARLMALMAIGLAFKESINYWHRIRKVKIQKDVLDDAEEQIDTAMQSTTSEPAPAAATRTARKKRARLRAAKPVHEDERHYAEILEMTEPYTLAQAKQNHRRLIKLAHPDSAGVTSSERSAHLNEALEWFTRLLS